MKRNDKWYGIYFLLIFIFYFSIVRPRHISWSELYNGIFSNDTEKEGFIFGGSNGWGGVTKAFKKIKLPWVDPCNSTCKARKAARARAAAAAAALAKRKRDCINTGGKWDGGRCHKQKAFPGNIFKRNPGPPPPPPTPSFCDQNPDILKNKCNKINSENGCNNKKCCSWCPSKNKCIYHSYITHANTLDTLEC